MGDSLESARGMVLVLFLERGLVIVGMEGKGKGYVPMNTMNL